MSPRTFGKDKDYGSVERGKVADLSIIEGDPLEDIWMTQNVKMVIMDGKVIDIGVPEIQEIRSRRSTPTSRCLRRSKSRQLFISGATKPTVLSVHGDQMWPFHRVMLER